MFPIVMWHWTSFCTLYSNGWCMQTFAVFYWPFDVKGWKKWAFWLVVIGLNLLTIYIVQELFVFSCVSVIFVGGLANHAGVYRVLVMAVATVATKWLFLYFLYRRKIFLKA